MSFNAINGNEINGVSFPGSESGLSLVQLVGSVAVIATMSSFTLRLTASAHVTASSASSPTATKARFLVGATTGATVVSSVGALTKIRLDLEDQTATATANATAIRKLRLPAATEGVATATNSAVFLEVPRSAIVDAKIVSSVIPFRLEIVGAATDALAIASAGTRVKTLRSGSTVAYAGSSTRTTARFRLPAGTTGVASVSAGTLRKMRLSISGSGVATSQNPAFKFIRQLPLSPAVAAAVSPALAAIFKISVGGATASPSASFSVAAGLRMPIGATTTATVSYINAAADFASRVPAPIERTMVLPFNSRRMEVTA